MPSGWHLSTVLWSSGAFLEPFLYLGEIESDVLPEFEMGNWIGCVLSGPVKNE